jgi:hypothetical protein
LCNFFSSSCSFFAIILATDKTSTDALSGAVSSKINGLGRILTGDLRHVKTEDLGLFEAFSVGDITVRKANDPSCIV